MRAGDARLIGRQWVERHLAARPGFRGALWHGSLLDVADDAPLPAGSDLDLLILHSQPIDDLRPGKRLVEGVLLDATPLRWENVSNPGQVLANHHLAPSFNRRRLLADADGEVRRLCDQISAEFPRRQWIERRCQSAVSLIHQHLERLDPAAPFVQNVMSWLFGTGITTHVLLVAGLRNPTVRRRYVAARSLLDELQMPQAYAELLDLLGSRAIDATAVRRHLDALAEAFDAAVEAIRSPFPFASDLTRAARPIAIDGSRAMIDAGDHREAMFWIAVTWTRCMQVFEADAPDLLGRFDPNYRAMLADLGIRSPADVQQRGAAVEAYYLPRLDAIKAAIMEVTTT